MTSDDTAAEYRRLGDLWRAGDRDRERAFHLLYAAWINWADPPHTRVEDFDDVAIWREVFEHFGGETSTDAEFLYVAALMTWLTPWAFDDEDVWTARSQSLKARARTIQPVGFAPTHFAGRGAYGDYFEHQARGGGLG